MIKNILCIIGLLITLGFYYLLYEYQNTKFDNLNAQLDKINNKLDSLVVSNNAREKSISVGYKQNNIVRTGVINFTDSLTNLFNGDDLKLDFDSVLNDKIIPSGIIDTFCYDLSEQYKIINFYNNKIRIKNLLAPGSILMSINDSLIHNDVNYTLKKINGKDSFVEFKNVNDNIDCKLHKVISSY